MEELTKIWFIELLEREIKEVNGTISNICLWLKSCETQEDSDMFLENLKSQEDYKQFLLKVKKQVVEEGIINV